MNNIISYRKYTYIISIVLVTAAMIATMRFGLVQGIDFTGGTLIEVGCPAVMETAEDVPSCTLPDPAIVREQLDVMALRSVSVQQSQQGTTATLLIRYVASDENQNEHVITQLTDLEPQLVTLRTDFIGSSVSDQLKNNTQKAIIIAIIAITLYIAWAFRKVSFFVPSWFYGVGAVVALVHDVLIVVGVFAILGYLSGVEVGVPFVAALLTILGYSVNDTIVVYDRVRENILRLGRKKTFEELANQSIRETLARSMNTSLTVVVVLIAVMLFGGASLYYFALALLVGVVAGTYSSIFVATALLVTSYNKFIKTHQS
jgi:preprotein translocase subunit SecF